MHGTENPSVDFRIPDENFAMQNSRLAFTPHPCGAFISCRMAFQGKNELRHHAEGHSKAKTCFGTMPKVILRQKWASASCRMAFQGKNELRHHAEWRSKTKMGFGIVPKRFAITRNRKEELELCAEL